LRGTVKDAPLVLYRDMTGDLYRFVLLFENYNNLLLFALDIPNRLMKYYNMENFTLVCAILRHKASRHVIM